MNKAELIERIAREAGVPEGDAQRHFGAFERVVAEALKGGEEVRITGFGKFSVKERKAREGRNPRPARRCKSRPRRSRLSARATPSRGPSRSFRTGARRAAVP